MIIVLAILAAACPPWCSDPVNHPCDCADTDGSGRVNMQDFEAVLYLVGAGNAAGDTNCDGTIDPDDLADWVVAYFNCVG